MLKNILVILIFSVLLVSCGKVSKEKALELEKISKKLISAKEEYNKTEMSFKEEILKNYEEKKQINEKSKLYLIAKLKYYKISSKEKALTIDDFIKFTAFIPKEIFSSTSRISENRDFNGGWFIDITKEKVEENINLKKILK